MSWNNSKIMACLGRCVMNLHDPSRPSIAGRPAFLGGTAIPTPQVWPLPNGSYAVKLMLPIQGEGFGCMWFQTIFLTGDQLLSFLHHFKNDPEWTLESIFSLCQFKPSLRHPSTPSLTSQSSADDLGL